MRILWISHLLPYPPKGGVQLRSYNLIREIARTAEVHFIGLYQRAHQPTAALLAEGTAALEGCCSSVEVHPFASFGGRASWALLVGRSYCSSRSYKELWAASPLLAESMSRRLSETPVDIVHFDTISLAPYRRLLPPGQPVVINHHNIESAMLLRRSANQRHAPARHFLRREAAKILALEQQHCPSAMNLVVSELDRDRLREIVPGAAAEVIPNGVDVAYFSPRAVTAEEKSLLWVGGLTWYPNLEAVRFTLREIWPPLTERHPDARLYIIGRQPPPTLVKEAQGFAGVEFLGFVDDIRPWMSRATGFICPIRDGGGTRLKVLNALAMGTPLLATPMACEGVPVTDGHDVLLADAPGDFVRQADRLFGDAGLRAALSANARRLIESEFDFAVIGRRLEAVYRRTAGSWA